MNVHINQARCDNLSSGIIDFRIVVIHQIFSNVFDPAVFNKDIGNFIKFFSRVNDAAALYQ